MTTIIGTCRLCLTPNSELQDSHILPRWAYKRMRDEEEPNPNPVIMSKGVASQKCQQVTEYLLCESCEDRFGKVENRVSRVTYQVDGSAPFLAMIGDQWGRLGSGELCCYPGTLPLADLTYFGASVIWRGSVSRVVDRCKLGDTYSEAFRRYLFGVDDFPAAATSVIWFYDLPSSKARDYRAVMHTPTTNRAENCHRHDVLICGINFRLLVGSRLGESTKRLCLHRGSNPVVALAPHEHLEDWPGRLVTNFSPIGKLAKKLASQNQATAPSGGRQ